MVNHPALLYEETVHMAVEQNYRAMQRKPGFVDMHVALSSNPHTPELICAVIFSRFNKAGKYPSYLKVKLPSGKMQRVNVEVITSFGTPKAHASDGDGVCGQNSAYFKGTICGAVKDIATNSRKFYLTCSHVLSGGDAVNKNGEIAVEEQEQVLNASTNFEPIGKWSYGLLTDQLDAALIDASDYETPAPNSFSAEVVPFGISLIGQIVFINGAMNKEKGFIVGQSNAPVAFEYNNQIHSISNLIKISRYQYVQQSLTSPGDSGAVAYLSDTKQPLGMVVGANDQFTFLIPFTGIFSVLPVSF